MALATLLATLVTSGCASLRYYSQAVTGHLDLMSRREPIDALLEAPDLDPALRERLETVQSIRRFAVEQLALPDNRSYTRYADLERDAAVYLVSAAPELSLEAHRWCVLVVGCLTYRGYFDAEAAEAEARRLAATGFDTRVTPGIAYSTLGWTADPVLNTMLRYSDDRLAGLIFHELAHQVVYAKDDAAFSEAFATSVERVGRQRWLDTHGGPEALAALERERQRDQQFTALLEQTRQSLEALYRGPLDDERKRAGKAEQFRQLTAAYERLKVSWDGYSGYDGWFDRGPNNADLALLATYESRLPALLALLRQLDGDLGRYYQRVRELADLAPEARSRALADLAAAAGD